MSKFEKEGVDRQYGAMTVHAAKRAFHFSCNRCATIGRQKSCKFCAIADAHHNMVNFVLNS